MLIRETRLIVRGECGYIAIHCTIHSIFLENKQMEKTPHPLKNYKEKKKKGTIKGTICENTR